MSLQAALDRHARRVRALAPAGHFVALRIRAAQPLVTVLGWPAAWVTRYAEQSYGLRDPLIGWGLAHTGLARWSEIGLPDPFGILGEAAEMGLAHGIVAAVGAIGARTVAAAARKDRPYGDDEGAAFLASVTTLHAETEPPAELTRPQADALRLVGMGMRYAAAAASVGISESAFKARLASARIALQARTTAEAVQRARDFGLI